ncbi:acetyl-CoA synthetase-like protein [Hypoxylon trugodes]|uniref:acetyl-CoA synthetase-like protein n=1 Tax=Hypoxylon trugodes TaxID=326681 RepID=UPI00219EF1B0|nr:acetyl-CoA synthetase-like protein [Hypoxylon trugodes]KAI1392009.1 acetyl-CoA synthetase-like protein [Hypoxylon trugodes]
MELSFRPLALDILRGSRQVPRCFLHRRLAQSRMASRVTRHSAWNYSVQRRGIATSNLSYFEGPREPPLLPHTIPEHFSLIVSQYGDQPAVLFRSPTPMDTTSSITIKPETTTLTYEALDAQSNSLAHSLRSLGVKKGDRVAVSLGNVDEHVVTAYALFKLGAILVPLNPTFNSLQLSNALSRLEVEVLIIGAVTDLAYKPCRGRSNFDLLKALVPDLTTSKVASPTVPSLKSIVVIDNTPSHPQSGFPPLENLRALIPFSTLLPPTLTLSTSSSRSIVPDTPLSADEIINIQFTSGTTSLPKAAMLSHTSILNNGYLIAKRMGLDPSDRIVCPPPLFHCFGIVLGLQATATTGAALLFPSPAFDPAAALHMAAEQGASGLYGVPTMFAAELELLSNPQFASTLPSGKGQGLGNLRKGIAAGSSVPEPLMKKLNSRLGLQDLVICYGMTETSPVSCMTAPGDPPEKRAGSIGRAMPHTKVKVVESGDRSKILPRGERGELAVSGYLLMEGYFNDAERTAEDLLVEDGGVRWMYTGDEARMDELGFVEVTGRIKDLIIRAGENIHPLEVEVVLMRHPLIREASVVGVPDERYGEIVGAFVAPHAGIKTVDGGAGSGTSGDIEAGVATGGSGSGVRDKKAVLSKDDAKDWVRGQLSGHLVPKYVFWIDEFPKTASGKIQKYKLRELAKELSGSTSR